ncbi:TauD/TfdA family dioxygenase [Streptomyces sp. NPDC056061]|uniref:TauD/TfdA family dioxygenase n=1 Tax=Streptomyces sp. NPDC056061 TaxID=3345700 RepID=UPI0035D63EC0
MEFPAVLQRPPAGSGLASWLVRHAEQVDHLLATTGAIVLRGFGVRDAAEFHDAIQHPLGTLMQYVEGASPRIPLGDGLYTSTEYAPDLTVSLHNELSYSHQWPGRVAFYCRTPAAHGGQTPIADSRKVFARLATRLPGMLPDEVRYVRHLHDGTGAGQAWTTVFATDDKAAVATYCATAGIGHQWLADGTLRTSQVRPTALLHPLTGEAVWFNQAHQWHPSNSGTDDEAMLRELFGDALPMNALRPDGQEIGATVLTAIREAYQSERVQFDWRPGDVMVLDNMLTAHGRAPFTGAREVLVAMGQPIRLTDVERVTYA